MDGQREFRWNFLVFLYSLIQCSYSNSWKAYGSPDLLTSLVLQNQALFLIYEVISTKNSDKYVHLSLSNLILFSHYNILNNYTTVATYSFWMPILSLTFIFHNCDYFPCIKMLKIKQATPSLHVKLDQTYLLTASNQSHWSEACMMWKTLCYFL